MEPQVTPQPPARDMKLKVGWWLVAAAMTVSTVLAAMEKPMDWMAIVGRASLIGAAVLLATARPEESRAKKVVIYALAAVSLGLWLARVMNR